MIEASCAASAAPRARMDIGPTYHIISYRIRIYMMKTKRMIYTV